MEGEGFVAFFKGSKLQWILHMKASEAFSSVKCTNGKIFVTATNYPHNNSIEIPEEEPGKFVFDEKYNV